MEQLWKKVFCCTCCEQGPCFNYVWSLVANIQSPSEGEKRKQYFFPHSFSWLIILSLWLFDLLFFMNVPAYTYRVSLDWQRAAKSGFVQCFKHSPQCPAAASCLTLLQCWETSLLGAGKGWELVGTLQKQGLFFITKHNCQHCQLLKDLLTEQQCWLGTDPEINNANKITWTIIPEDSAR